MKQSSYFRRLLCAAAAGILLTGCGLQEISASPGAAPESSAAGTEADSTAESTSVSESAQPEPNGTGATKAPASAWPDDAVIIEGVPHLDQSTGYATACESLAACSLLQFYGYDIQPGDFIRKHLPVTDYPYDTDGDGILNAESPWDYFIGNPLKSNGYGCYSTAILKAIEKYQPGIAEVLRDVPLSDLCRDYIGKGQPVMLWATIEMQPTREGHRWTLPNGEAFHFVRPEHALVLIGYDSQHYYFCDSLQPDDVTQYDKTATETAYKALYQQAIVIHQDNPETDINAGN